MDDGDGDGVHALGLPGRWVLIGLSAVVVMASSAASPGSR